ncbi:tetratricopeptide repeat protein [Desulfospira joergensenii]|uniref:tetratricopeptide repeat protein n=1 Tax=Desulfospira joergensenii TaxID=53329 RepID=UPI0003B5CB86|nr:hypothetical protein [Desulfospira joergensenii]
MNLSFVGKLVFPLLIFMIFLASPVWPGNDISPGQDEKALLAGMGPSPSADDLEKLGRIRLQSAAARYKKWHRSGNEEDYAGALVYAKSAVTLLPDSDEVWLLLGMIRSELKADPSAMAASTDALIRAVDINPANGRAQLLLAQVLMEQGRYWSSIEQFKMLIAGSKAMRTGTVLSQLTFCYIADGRIQAGLNYIQSLNKTVPLRTSSAAKLEWLEWQLINTAVLMRARGDRKDAIGFLNLMFYYGGREDANPQRTDGRIRQVNYLLSLWKKGGMI